VLVICAGKTNIKRQKWKVKFVKNMIKLLGRAKGYVLLIILLLIVQAYCDLALPSYTSDILNVGLQQNGIEDAVPDSMRQESMDMITLFMSDEDAEKIVSAYSEAAEDDADKILRLKTDADRDELNSLLLIPESIVYQMSNTDEGSAALEQIKQAYSSGMLDKETILTQMDEELSQMENLTDTYLSQIAVNFVKAEYEAQGVSIKSIRNKYLFKEGLKMLGVAFVMMAVAILAGLIASVVSARIGRDLRQELYEKVMSFTSAEIDKFSTASLITRCTNDIQQVQMLTVMLLRMVIYAPILAVAGILKVLQTGGDMGWIIVLAVAVLILTIGVLMVIANPKFKIMQSLVDKLNLVSRELLTGIMPIRAFGRQDYEEKRFEKANTNLYKTQLFTNRTMTFMMPVMMLVMNGVSVLIVWVGGHGVDSGTVQVGDLTAFITYSMVIIMSFLMLSMISIMLPRASVAADRIMEVLGTDISLFDAENVKDEALSGEGVLAFNDVTFSYPGAESPVLENISFKAEPGKTTAIIGSTGCGKSTLINLIPRFYDVTEGEITLDGIDIRDISQKKLRDNIGLVPQKGMLFSGTIETNLKYGGENITDDDMKQAAEIAQAMEFIDGKDDGFDSTIAQDGSNVSGGQRQRLSIARAIAKHPKIFVFDDSFSALDYKTDAALRKALAEKTKNATVIIVAQRISTIMHADQILVMDEGKIVGKGTHRELLENCEVYMEIAKGQLSEAEIERDLAEGRA
jgi:ATP-binding cassette subfamily B protein